MPIGLDYGLLAALAWGSTDVLATIGGRRLGSLRVTAIAELTSLAIVTLLAVLRGEGLPRDPGIIAAAAILGVVGAGAYLSFFTALRIGPIAVVSPVVAAYGGLTVVLSVTLRGESLTPLQALGATVATLGVVLAGVVSDGGWRGTRIVGRGVLLSLLAMVLFAALTVGLAGPIRVAGWLPILLVSRFANAVTIWLLLAVVMVVGRHRVAALMGESGSVGSRALAAAGLTGVLDTAGFVVFAVGLEVAPTWIVGLASSFGPAVTVLVAVVLWGERLRPSQWLGLAGIAVGLAVVAIP
jgi:drug/metabolite transporter (DMT)-like permease